MEFSNCAFLSELVGLFGMEDMETSEEIIRVVLVEDEKPALNALKILIETYCPALQVVGKAHSVAEGISVIRATSPDVVFLDVEMPDGYGFDLLTTLQPFDFKAVFTTAFEGYALQAIKQAAFDYLLKPIDPEELKLTVSKLQKSLTVDIVDSGPSIAPSELQIRKGIARLLLPEKDAFRVVEVQQIVRCEAQNNYTRFFLTDNTQVLVAKTLKEYSDLLELQDFFRIHQSHLVNLDHVTHYLPGRGGNLVMEDGEVLPVSRDKKAHLLQQLDLGRAH